ncbi:MAG TPA: S1/P1 nuclease [Steroidobacteraceae bacterium]|nr:S1/P1 nuclease [Steroidobacteraceae bacterium]
MKALFTLARVGYLAALCCGAHPVFAWGDEGHEVIGLIADHYLEPAVRAQVQSMLEEDDSGLTARDMAHEAAWADKFRDSDRNTTRIRYERTRNWHFVDLEITGVDVNSACYGRPRLPAGTAASEGPAEDCVIDKIEQFRAELENPRTDPRERRLALQFLLHLIGDVHQPLHASDDHDQGGNRKIVSASGIPTSNLHHDWDIEFVERLGPNATDIAARLIAKISDAERSRWSQGTPTAWALESFSVAKAHAYGLLPAPSSPGRYQLPDSYVADAIEVTAEQLSKGGVRLAFVLNQALARRP